MAKKQQKKTEPQEFTQASESDTLPYPWPVAGHAFTDAQIVATAEHLLAIPGWVPTERVIAIAQELIELVDDEFDEFEDEDGKTVRVGSDEDAARYAVLAARLIETYGLVLADSEDPNA